jgi:hypothetical protein
MILTQSFNGAGDTWTPTIINLFVFWLWGRPLAYVLAVVCGLGPRGVFLAITDSFFNPGDCERDFLSKRKEDEGGVSNGV